MGNYFGSFWNMKSLNGHIACCSMAYDHWYQIRHSLNFLNFGLFFKKWLSLCTKNGFKWLSRQSWYGGRKWKKVDEYIYKKRQNTIWLSSMREVERVPYHSFCLKPLCPRALILQFMVPHSIVYKVYLGDHQNMVFVRLFSSSWVEWCKPF